VAYAPPGNKSVDLKIKFLCTPKGTDCKLFSYMNCPDGEYDAKRLSTMCWPMTTS